MERYRHILLATDLLEESRVAELRAVEISQRYGARLSLMHVVEQLPVDYVAEGVPIEVPDVTDELQEQAQQSLERMAQRLGVKDADCWVQVGSARVDIPEYAKERGVDLIVVGARERHGLAVLLPNTTDGVVHHAPCDVLAVHVT